MKNNVLHIRSTIGMYGAEQVILNLLQSVRDLAHKTRCFIIEGSEKQSDLLAVELSNNSLEYHSEKSYKKFDFSVVKKLRKEVKKYSVGVVHSHDYKSLVLICIATIGLDVTRIHHLHGALGNTSAEKIYSLIERLFMIFVNKIIVVSQEQENIYKKYLGLTHKLVHIENGSPIKEIFSKDHAGDVFSFIMVARLTPEKNHELALKVLAKLIHEGRNVCLSILGSGPELPRLKLIAEDLGIIKKVKFVGFTRNVEEWMRKANCLLITSTTEGMPMNLLEAMSYGLPSICTPVGEIPKIIESSEGGKLANNEEQFVQVASEYCDSPEKIKEMGLSASRFVKKYLSVTRQSNSILEVYESTLGGVYERCIT